MNVPPDLAAFRASLGAATPPDGLGPPLLALWWDARGDWDRAHLSVQDEGDATSALVHAYLHRKEGDLDNAAYWYGCAGRAMPAQDLGAEWDALAGELTRDGG